MITNLANKFDAQYGLRILSNRSHSRKADLQTFRNVIQDYPQWGASFFDEHFFKLRVIPMIEAARKNGKMVNSSQVTSAWADQFHLDVRSRENLMRKLGLIAEQLLAELGCNSKESSFL